MFFKNGLSWLRYDIIGIAIVSGYDAAAPSIPTWDRLRVINHGCYNRYVGRYDIVRVLSRSNNRCKQKRLSHP